MRTVRPPAGIPIAAIVLAFAAVLPVAACGSDAASSDTSYEASAPVPPTNNDLGIDASTTVPGVTAVPSNDSSADEPLDGPVQIDVRVGLDSGPDRIEYLKVGADVTLNITNPTAADSFHVHGVDLERDADANSMVTFNFVVDTPGTYEVESHVTGGVLVVLRVV